LTLPSGFGRARRSHSSTRPSPVDSRVLRPSRGATRNKVSPRVRARLRQPVSSLGHNAADHHRYIVVALEPWVRFKHPNDRNLCHVLAQLIPRLLAPYTPESPARYEFGDGRMGGCSAS